MRTLQKLVCLAVAGVCTFAVCLAHAQNISDVDWDSNNFWQPPTIYINVGDEIDFFNMDTMGIPLQTTGDLALNIDPGSDAAYIFPTPGTFTATDEFGDTLTINVIAPLLVPITSPANNAVFSAPATFSITAMPSGGYVPYSYVQFLLGTTDVGDITNSPYTTTVTNLPAGSYVISAIVTDANFDMATNTISVSVIVASPPRLAAARAGNQLLVSWPTNNNSGYSLESTTNLRTPWSAVTQPVTAIGTNWVVTNSISGPRMFFRLSNP